jgi:hypothetical protein
MISDMFAHYDCDPDTLITKQTLSEILSSQAH